MFKLVNAKQMIADAYHNKYAIPAFNINNLEWIKVILQAANEANTPVLLATSEGAVKYMGGYLNCVQMVVNIANHLNIKIPVALHLDHGTFEGCKKAIDVGYTSVMYDGSKLNINENIKNSQAIIDYAKNKDISIELEVGGIGGVEDGITSDGELADVNECIEIAKLDFHMLACGIGNIHGVYPDDWKGLNFSLLQEINQKTKMPIVLHGGSGIDEKQIIKAIGYGVSKININTECQIAFAQALQSHLASIEDLVKQKKYDPRKILEYGTKAIYDVVLDKLKKFKVYSHFNKG